jgi:hypothetical protein
LITVIAGATAVGGGDLTVVVLLLLESVVLLLVESVTIGSIAHALEDKAMTKSTAVAIFLVILLSFYYYSYQTGTTHSIVFSYLQVCDTLYSSVSADYLPRILYIHISFFI